MNSFISATSIKKDWQQAADDLLLQIGDIPAEANVAFIYSIFLIKDSKSL